MNIYTLTTRSIRSRKYRMQINGYDCAKQMIDLINVKKQAASKPLYELPPLFNPMSKGFFDEPYHDILRVNKDALEIYCFLHRYEMCNDLKAHYPTCNSE